MKAFFWWKFSYYESLFKTLLPETRKTLGVNVQIKLDTSPVWRVGKRFRECRSVKKVNIFNRHAKPFPQNHNIYLYVKHRAEQVSNPYDAC